MGIGLDVYHCTNCGVRRRVDGEKRKSLRRGAVNLFCSRSCARSFHNKTNSPMSLKSTRKKLSKTCLKQGKWSGIYNPNFSGVSTRKLWEQGRYDNRDLSGSNNPAWIDGRSFEQYGRGSDWNVQRLKTLKRDGFRCTKCGGRENLVVHHKNPYIISKSNELSNLETLCRECHGEIHMVIGWRNFSQGDQNVSRC